MKTIDQLQTEVSEWSEKTFGTENRIRWTALGILEEFGEFVHAQAKSEHGHRGGTPEHWVQEKKDAIGDIFIFALDHCTVRGWRFVDLINEAEAPPSVETFADVQALQSYSIMQWNFLDVLMEACTEKYSDSTYYLSSSDMVALVLNWSFYCSEQGWSLQEIIEKTWDEVRTRDQNKRTVTT